MAPAINGDATVQFIELDAVAMMALPADTIVKTPREVATMDFMGKSVNFFNAGTMIKPPPTPSNPERNPATAPDSIKDLAQGTVQMSFPID